MAGQTSSPEPERGKADALRARITIAAIMPVYNGRLWVEQALRSVLAQSVVPDEIIVIDDGCTDDSIEIVRTIAKEEPRIRVVAQVNAGQSAARNLAISLCRSDWIALI